MKKKNKEKAPLTEDQAFRNSIDWIMTKKTINGIPYEVYEKHIYDFDHPETRTMIMALLNDIKFIKKAMKDEMGEEQTSRVFERVEEMKKNPNDYHIPGYDDNTYDPYFEFIKKRNVQQEEKE